MKHLIVISILLLAAIRSFAVGGDITGASIDPNGRDLILYISALNTNGTYTMGLDTNNTIRLEDPAITLAVTRPTFDTNGTYTTTTEYVYGMTPVNKAYPNNNSHDEIFDAATQVLACRIVLNRFIYTNDTLTATIDSGIYSQGGTNNNSATAIAVTNNTVASYQKVIGNWTMPAWQRITNSTMTLSAVGFHQSGRNRRPIKFAQFVVSDEHSHVVTNTVTDWSVQWSLGERLKIGELVTTFDTTAFTDHDQLRCDFVMFPWIGDTNCVFNTKDNVFTGVTAYPASVTNFLDIANNYSVGIAVVDAAGTNAASFGVTNAADVTTIPSSLYFATISAAANAMSRYNQTNGTPTHADIGGGVIYVKSSIVNFAGGTFSSNTVPKCFLTIKPYPGDSVTLTNDTGSNDSGARVKIEDMTFAFPASTIPFGSSGEYLWFQRCVFNSSGTAPFETKLNWVTDSSAPLLTQGFRAFGTANQSFMCRNVDLTGFNGIIRPTLMIGCYHPTTNGPLYTVVSDGAGQTSPGPDYQICYNNDFRGSLNNGSTVFTVGSTNLQFGAAWVQNIFETATNAVPGLIGLGTGTTATITNLLCINNVAVGNRMFTLYNDVGTNALYRRFNMYAGNITEVNGCKSDSFAPGDSNRIGNWDIMYMVNCRGNLFQEMEGGPAPAGAFPPYFAGLNSYHPFFTGGGGHITNEWGFAKFISQNTVQLPGTVTNGGGNYRYQSSSPVWNYILAADYLPIDLDGYGRGGFDPPGAFTSGCAKKGAFFGGQ